MAAMVRTPGLSAAATLLLLLGAACVVAAAPPRRHRILALIPMSGTSHSFEILAVAGLLATRHNVTVATPAAGLDHTLAAIRRLGADAGPMRVDAVAELPDFRDLMKHIRPSGTASAPTSLHALFRAMARMPAVMAGHCGRLVANTTLMEAWRGFDAVLTFPFCPPAVDSCACVVSHAIGAPLVYSRNMVLLFPPIDVPQMGTGLTRSEVRGTWSGFLQNAATWAVSATARRTLGFLEAHHFWRLRNQLGLPLGSERSGRTCRPWVEVVSSSWLLEEPQPLEPPQVIIGPISARPSHPAIVDAPIAAFAEAAQASGHGLVLVSFGSISDVFGGALDITDYENLALAFADLAPVSVLWQLAPGALPASIKSAQDLPLGSNTVVVPWVPFNDVLGHPATRAVVTHGGLKSMYEALFQGVPMVVLPFVYEQLANGRRAAARGYGLVSPESPAARPKGVRFSRDGLSSLVRKVLTPSPYASAAEQAGAALRLAYDQHRPLERAAEEIELALLHKGYHTISGPGEESAAEMLAKASSRADRLKGDIVRSEAGLRAEL
ncbi:UDP-glucuronosyltransferase 2A1 precursor [Raphidocelis subcapitata]|uniref:UDP-glucuronosyltransferase 2A1 n=1 Tax=Raphidocelis subcapitata TaxID=307507 RepID=A0A2V0PFA1_9CHLO|nr:UDP-glucuronosyltransferase 2A1 precursor [Raphidocelis subcapitata]|eukprot:GBF97662.1 UDP-glucuronosyltransferase 2A1 precursor [Raphidocelis subcapitata]